MYSLSLSTEIISHFAVMVTLIQNVKKTQKKFGIKRLNLSWALKI